MKRTILFSIVVISILTLLSGCFTGIEGTKKIELTKDDVKASAPTAEDNFWSDIMGIPFSEWEAGKTFLATEDRVALIFDQQGLPADYESLHLGGEVFEYEGRSSSILPNGNEAIILLFKNGDRIYRYNIRGDESKLSSLTSADIPMLMDMELVKQANQKTKNKKVWTRTALWYDNSGNRVAGKKFVPVTISEVRCGNTQFPLKVFFTDSAGNEAVMWMSLGNSALDSRSFPNLFSLTDPKNRYPKIEEDVWSLIQQGRVREGMTKEECKLSIGNPTKVEIGHDYSQTIDIWIYSDGQVLRFIDGLLTADRF